MQETICCIYVKYAEITEKKLKKVLTTYCRNVNIIKSPRATQKKKSPESTVKMLA